jgi:hypothetical protein
MAHQFLISDETYITIVALAKERGQTPEELATDLLQRQVEAEWEAACAQYDDLTTSAQWQQMEAAAEAEISASNITVYDSDDALKKAFESHQ